MFHGEPGSRREGGLGLLVDASPPGLRVAGRPGFEPGTYGLKARRSTRLSYRPRPHDGEYSRLVRDLTSLLSTKLRTAILICLIHIMIRIAVSNIFQ